MEVLLVRFQKPERAFIRKESKKRKCSEAAIVRMAVETFKFHANLDHGFPPATN